MNGSPGAPVPLTFTFHTADKSLCDFARRYWDAKFGPGKALLYAITVRDLAAEFGWKTSDALTLVKEVAQVTYLQCANCAQPLIVTSRSELNLAMQIDKDRLCGPCMDEYHRKRQEEYRDQVRQQQLREERRRQEIVAMPLEQVRQLCLNRLYQIPAPIDRNDFTVTDAVYLLAAFRASQSEYLNYILPLAGTLNLAHSNVITPGSLYSTELINRLLERKLISPAPQSNHSAFDWTSENSVTQYYLYRVIWRIAPADSQNGILVEMIDGIFKGWGNNVPQYCAAEVSKLWLDIALHECIEFLQHEMTKHKMKIKLGEMTHRVLKNGLTTYSVAQMYNHIYRAAKDAAAYWVEKSNEISIFQAANSVVSRIENNIERARVNNYDVKLYSRNFECPRSMISRVLFDTVLGIGDAGFNEVPRLRTQATSPV